MQCACNSGMSMLILCFRFGIIRTMPCVEVPTSKVNHNGIETIPAVTYQGWEPGKEYTKNIVLKNVMVKTQKLTYK